MANFNKYFKRELQMKNDTKHYYNMMLCGVSALCVRHVLRLNNELRHYANMSIGEVVRVMRFSKMAHNEMKAICGFTMSIRLVNSSMSKHLADIVKWHIGYVGSSYAEQGRKFHPCF